jgi:hypothetical protein
MHGKARFGERKNASESGAAHPNSNPESKWPELPWGKAQGWMRFDSNWPTLLPILCYFTLFQGVAVGNRVSEMDGLMRGCVGKGGHCFEGHVFVRLPKAVNKGREV